MVFDLPARCVIVSSPFRPAFPFLCALLAQRLRSVRLISSCVARSAFPSRPLRRPFTTRVFASSVPFSVALRAVLPYFPPRPLRFPFHRASSTQSSSPVACIPVLFHVAFKHVRRPLHFVTHFGRVIHYSVTFFLLFDVLIIKSSSFGFGITLVPRVWLKVTLH